MLMLPPHDLPLNLHFQRPQILTNPQRRHILSRQCANLLPSRDRRGAVHDLLDQIAINRIPRVFERVLRTFPVRGGAGNGWWTADADAVRARLAQRIQIRAVRICGVCWGEAGR